MKQTKHIELLKRRISKNADENAFQSFFNLFADCLFQFAMTFLKNTQLAEEVVSDVFFKIWINKKELEDIDNIKAYLYKATCNTSLNYLDEEKRTNAFSLEAVAVDLGVDMVNPESELITKELKKVIEKAIDSLPPRCKLIFKLAKVEQMKYREISEILEISVKTIDHQLTIALKKIGIVIEIYLTEEEDSSYSF